MQQYARIKSGVYGKHKIKDAVFPLVAGVAKNPKGLLYVTVDGEGSNVKGIEPRNCRIKVKALSDVEIVSEKVHEDANRVIQAVPEVDDATRTAQIQERFDILDEMTGACKSGTVRAMIVSGPAGVGKSYGITSQLQKSSMFENLKGELKWEVVKGATSAIGLYKKLYQYSSSGNVLVFDDCDAVFDEPLALNILKAALDSKKKRTIHWNTDSFKLRNEGVPDSFEFKGSAIFITNLKFDQVKSKKLKSHLEALESRCHYMDLTIDTERDKMLRIAQVIQDGMLNSYKLDDEVKEEIVDFVDINKKRLRELSLRTVLKVADLAVAFPDKWEAMAENTVMVR